MLITLVYLAAESATMIAAIAIFASIMISFPVAFGQIRPLPGEYPGLEHAEHAKAPVAVSGSNIYTARNNASATLHGDLDTRRN
jgi:hypothetical protein